MEMEDLFEVNKSLLKSTVLDEGKLITYVSISKDLCVHVNISKIMLHRLVEHIREETSNMQLNVCYIISGATDYNNARTIVCPEQNLIKEKKCFKNIFFEHIYSVAKGRPNIDTAAYIAVNKFEDFALCSGLIKSKQCDKRTLQEIGDLKSNNQEINVPEKSKSLPITSKSIKKEANTAKNGNNEIKLITKQDKESKSEPVIKQEKISPKKETVQSINNNKAKMSFTAGHKTQKGITGFFNKTNNSNKEIKDKLQNSEETKQVTDTIDVKHEKMEVEQIIPTVKVKVEDKKESKNKILNQIKKTSKVDKKRKRVLHVSDSESDNENNDPFVDECVAKPHDQVTYDSEDEIPPTPTVTNIVIKSGIVNPKKRRKIVDKTYTDEEGYILTKKVEVYESCSENEEDIKVQENQPPAKEVKNDLLPKGNKTEISPKGKTNGSKKKVSPPQKGKQATLTNFFKKI